MRSRNLATYAMLAVAAFLAIGSSAQAQTRTWVSGVGNDANPCSRTAPCKTFAGAISKTSAGGEINVLDPGGFGAVTITKSISIVNDGAIGGVLASFANGVVINAGVNDVIVLKGLDIEGATNGLNGIRFLAGAALHVQDCRHPQLQRLRHRLRALRQLQALRRRLDHLRQRRRLRRRRHPGQADGDRHG